MSFDGLISVRHHAELGGYSGDREDTVPALIEFMLGRRDKQ